MAQQHFMSFSDLESSGLLSSKGNIVQYCIQVGILQQKQNCLSCRSDMILVKQTPVLMASTGPVKIAQLNKSLYDETVYCKGRNYLS